MWQIDEGKVIALTQGGLTGNCEESAEVIVLIRKCERSK
jgi:hypothetical protein